MKRGSISNRLLDRYLGIPCLFAISLFKSRRAYRGELKRIGLMASPGIGDTLLSSAAVLDIRHNYPAATLIGIAPSTSLSAVKLLPGLDQVISVDMTSPMVTARTIRRCRLDAIVDFTPWPRLTAFYTAVSGARLKAGFRTPGQYRHWNYDIIANHSGEVHELENFRALLRAMGLQPSARPSVTVPPVRSVQRDGEARIVIHPWASRGRSDGRSWPIERWIELASRLKGSGAIIVITGGAADRDDCFALQARLRYLGIPAETLCGVADLGEVAARLQSMDLVVSVNTGLMHLAAIVGAPTVSINGPVATHRYGPIGPRSTSVEAKEGGGFLHLGFEYKGNPADAMLQIGVDDVLDGIRRVAPQLVPGADRVENIEWIGT